MHTYIHTYTHTHTRVLTPAYFWVLGYENTPEQWGLVRIWGLFGVPSKKTPEVGIHWHYTYILGTYAKSSEVGMKNTHIVSPQGGKIFLLKNKTFYHMQNINKSFSYPKIIKTNAWKN